MGFTLPLRHIIMQCSLGIEAAQSPSRSSTTDCVHIASQDAWVGRDLRRGDHFDLDQPQLPRHNGLEAERAGGGLAQVVAPMAREMGHDGGEGEDVAAGRDLRADGGLQRDGAVDLMRRQHFHLRAKAEVGHDGEAGKEKGSGEHDRWQSLALTEAGHNLTIMPSEKHTVHR